VRDGDCFGPVVNLAARAAKASTPGAVVVASLGPLEPMAGLELEAGGPSSWPASRTRDAGRGGGRYAALRASMTLPHRSGSERNGA
jgi:hypothetical protein